MEVLFYLGCEGARVEGTSTAKRQVQALVNSLYFVSANPPLLDQWCRFQTIRTILYID